MLKTNDVIFIQSLHSKYHIVISIVCFCLNCILLLGGLGGTLTPEDGLVVSVTLRVPGNVITVAIAK